MKYFGKTVVEPRDGDVKTELEFGSIGVPGVGPHAYLRIDGREVIIPRVNEAEFFRRMKALGALLGH